MDGQWQEPMLETRLDVAMLPRALHGPPLRSSALKAVLFFSRLD